MFRRYLVGIFKNEGKLLAAVRCLRENKIAISDVYSPYAIHGIDEAMGVRRSRLAWVTLIAGFIGLVLAMYFQFWTSVVDWPVNVGGKPDNSTLAFLPVTFEITVLFGGLATVVAFLFRGKLFLGLKPKFFHEGISDDTFALVLEHKDASFDEGEAKQIMLEFGAEQVESKVVQR